MKKDLKVSAWLFAAFLMFFLCLQKPLFMLYNWGFGGTSLTFADLGDIYFHGLALDLATVGYLLALPLLLMGVHWCFPRFSPRPWLLGYCGIISVAISLAALADASLYEFWEFKLDRMAFFYLGDPKDAFASVSIGYMLVRFLAWMAFSAVTFALLTWPLRKGRFDQKIGVHPIVRLLLFLVIGGSCFAIIRGWRIWPNTPGRAFYSKTTYYNHIALNPLFNLFYSLTNEEDDYRQFEFFSEEDRAQIMEGIFPTKADSTELLINNQRPNVLVVVLEGFGSCFVPELGGDVKQVGVNIGRLQSEAVSFTNCYCGSFRTDRGIVCAVSGYLGQPTTSIMRFPHKIRNLPGLPKTLKQYGYQTQGLYGGDITFFNMSEYFITSGHDKLVTEDDFPASDRTTKWGVPDHVTFNWLFDDIQQKHAAQSEPWYTTFLTISSHNPFDVPYHKFDGPDATSDEYMFNAFAYTDSCYGDFIDRLKQTPAWDNLLIVTVADHGFNWRQIASPDFPLVPFFLLGGAIKEPRSIDLLMSQTDLPAIVLGQMGIPHEEFVFSRDVMGNTYRRPLGYNTFTNGFNLRDTTGYTVYDNDAKAATYGADEQREKLGKAILQTLYRDLSNR